MLTTGLILFAMIPAMALTMLNLGIGPFGHPSLIKHHQKFRTLPNIVRYFIQATCAFILIIGAAQMLGLIDLNIHHTTDSTANSSLNITPKE
ncbi:MAG: hypothetical protein ABNH15_01630 [Alcanivorax sp.]|jgi:hypothetical protein|nr:MAG: hypothetical protein COA68_13615 [Oceanobacter sp.]|tara:strand:- start:673 stop:948 length:276 start_codon:yes stop_codon:yes gene_type:complete